MPRNLSPKRPALFLLLMLFSRLDFSQLGCPPNIDFENGTFDGWDCFKGSTSVAGGKNVISLTPSAPESNYHELISDPNAKDPFGNFPQLCPYGGKYSVKLGNTCGTELSKPVTVIPKPKADFSFPPIICEAQTQLPLKNISTVPSSLSRLSKWWWSVAGTTSILPEPAAFIPTVPGPMEVKLVVTTDEGCASDTALKTIPVHYRPDAKFVLTNQFLCDNETVLFNNTSSLPVASFPENINIWNWKLDNSATYSTRHLALRLPAGLHHAMLSTETNFGCKSPETEMVFDVKKKPKVSVTVIDSCVYRLIYFRGTDHDLSVVNWKWDLGNGAGFKDGIETVRRSFPKEGDNSFTLITRNSDGCKDTIYRPYYVYDNKARAGKDTIVAKG